MVGWRVKRDFDRFRNIEPSDYPYITGIASGIEMIILVSAAFRVKMA